MAEFGMPPRFSRRAAEMGSKGTGKVMDVRITDRHRDFFDRQGRTEQQGAGAIHTGMGDIGGRRFPGKAGEQGASK